MWFTLLLLAPIAAEWVEISQQFYIKPRHQFNKATNPVDTVDVIKHNSDKTDKPYFNTVGKLSESLKKPNRIYINHTILQHDFNDDIFVEKPGTSAPKLSTRRPVSNVQDKPNKRGNTNDKTTTTEKHAVKITTKYDKKATGNKVVVLKDATRDEIPNRIYLLENEHTGSLEVLDWSDLDKLAEEDSEQFFRKKTKPEHAPSLQATSEYQTEATRSQEYNDDREKPAFVVEKVNRIDQTPIQNIKTATKIYDRLSNTGDKLSLDTASDKAVTIMQKHMVAKITKVNEHKAKPPKVEVIELQKENSTLSQIKDSIRKVSNNTKADIKSTAPLKTTNLSTTTKPIVFTKNRYENQVKGEKVPDPEEIMIQELLEETKDIEPVGENKHENGNAIEKNSESETIIEKGTKAPDPDEVMIKEILNAELDISRRKSTKRPSLTGSVQILKTSTETSSTTEYHTSNQSFVKETSTARSSISKERLENKNDIKISNNATKNYLKQSSKQEEVKKIDKDITASILDDKDYQIIPVTVSITTPKTKPTETLYEFIKQENIRKDEISNMKAEESVQLTTSTVIPEEVMWSQEESIKFNDRSSEYKSKVLLREPTPEFVSKEEFFTESEESVDPNITENVDIINSSTLDPFSTENNDNKESSTISNDESQKPNTSEKTNVISEPNIKISESSENNREETVNTNEKKENAIENVVKLLKGVNDIISKNTRRGFKSKVRYLEDLKNTLLTNIEDRLEATFPDSLARSARSLHAARGHDNSLHATARGHVDFPSSESALMTISFLTFAVFLIKLVLQVIHSYKNKSGPAVVAAVGRHFAPPS